jgi:hypothetical protein
MHRSRLTCALVLLVVLGTAVSMTSCGGGSGSNPDLVLLGFNVPNLSGIPLDQPLIFTFSANINPATITPDSLRVVGATGPFFEKTVVDGNLVALLPTMPNFADYSDAGFAPDTQYTVSMTLFPAVTTIESVGGKPLLHAESFTFRTLPAPSSDIVSNIPCNGPDGILGTADDDTPSSASYFVEPRRAIRHGTPPYDCNPASPTYGTRLSGRSDDCGCLQNNGPGNALFVNPLDDPTVVQAGSGMGARLLCLQNEGSPRVIEPLCIPRHNQQAVGDPSAVSPGLIDMPAIRIRINEPLDPLTVEPFFGGFAVNVTLWRVALKDGTFNLSKRPTNKPIVVQSVDSTEVILVPAGPQPQGIYLVNVSPAVHDLPGCPLRINDRPDPALNGYDAYEGMQLFQDNVPAGYRIYFKTLEVPDTPLSIIESFDNNLNEHGDNDSGQGEPGIYTTTSADNPGGGTGDNNPDGNPLVQGGYGTIPVSARTFDAGGDPTGSFAGQSTTALWNGQGAGTSNGPISDVDGYRFLNIPTLLTNVNPNNLPAGSLQHVQQPWAGTGADGAWMSPGGGAQVGWNTDTTSGDGILECTSFNLQAGDTLTVTGSKPFLIMCRGNFVCDGTIVLDGKRGGDGFDTDGSSNYSNAGAVSPGGVGGEGGPGGGKGGDGADPLGVGRTATGSGGDGIPGRNLFESMTDQDALMHGGGGPAGIADDTTPTNNNSSGGGGGGHGVSGDPGVTSEGLVGGVVGTDDSAGGVTFGSDAFMRRPLSVWAPDRGYTPFANVAGGAGGGGGSFDDDTGSSETGNTTLENGDDGGAGGGGGGGGIWIICRGTVTFGATAVVSANGGAGGNTYGTADQLFDDGPDGMAGTGDEFFTGLDGTPASASGDGGPGGGGAGGAIMIWSKGAVNVASGAVLSAQGGAGGTSGDATRVGGNGADGRIAIVTQGSPGITQNGTVTPAPATGVGGVPTHDTCSVGQSDWVDLFTNNTDFRPVVNSIVQEPTFNANFDFLTSPTPGGGGQVLGTDFNWAWEFQGADYLSPTPDVSLPTSADGLTNWVDASALDTLDGKRYIRWRWRFFAKDGYGEQPGDPANLPVPTVFDLTIPFIKQ